MFKHYLALGDSISIDLYPSLDTDGTSENMVGAASLLRKLLKQHHNPHIGFTNLTRDGAIISEVERQARAARSLAAHGEELLITVTAGGNDISFSAMQARDLSQWRENAVPMICRQWRLLIAGLISEFRDATIIVNTSYDPTEGTGTFGGHDVAGAWEDIVEEYHWGRGVFSEHIRNAVESAGIKNLLLADVRRLFEGHGVTAPEADRWYWREFMIEPNAEGARQIAELWLQTLAQAALVQNVQHPRLVV